MVGVGPNIRKIVPPTNYGARFTEDFMLCKAENRDPVHCLKEGRRVTRCATDL